MVIYIRSNNLQYSKRICDAYNYPIENAEPLQVVKYEPGGFFIMITMIRVVIKTQNVMNL